MAGGSTHTDREQALEEFLERKTPVDAKVIFGREPSKQKMQHNLARNLLIGFLLLIIVILIAVYKYNARFCNPAVSCGENFVNIKVVIDSLLDFGSPFIGIIIGFFFSEKFGSGRSNDD